MRKQPPALTSVTQTVTEGPPATAGSSDGLRPRDRQRYTDVAEHGRGGLGRVVRARDEELGREVAIKELIERGGSAEQRFLREALITARLEHPGIVPVHDAGCGPDGSPFYTMKLVSGRSLRELAAETQRWDDRLALLLPVAAVAEAIAYAHDRGVVHRDLKPANIIVGDYGETVVVDWGLAKDLRAPSPPEGADPYRAPAFPETTSDGTIVGTPAYMAPEQARGEEVDARADVYAIGAVLYSVLTGAAPYQGQDASAVVAAVRAGSPDRLVEREPRVPADLAAIVERAMARDRADRYPDASALAADLRRFQAGQLVSTHRYSSADRAARWLRRNRVAATIGVISLAAVTAIGAVSVARVVRSERDAVAQRNRLVLVQAENSLASDPTRALAWIKEYPRDGADRVVLERLVADAEALGAARHVLPVNGGVRALRFAADSRTLFSEAWFDPIRSWDALDGTPRRAFGPPGARLSSSSDDGTRLVYLDDLRRVMAVSGAAEPQPRAECASPNAFALSGDGRLLACAADDRVVRVFAFDGAAPITQLAPTGGIVERLAFAGGFLFATIDDGEVVRLDVASGARASVRLPRAIGAVHATGGSGGALVVDVEGQLWRWDGEGEVRHEDAIGKALAVAATEARAVVAEEGGLVILDLATGETRRLAAPGLRPRGVAIRGAWVVAGSADGALWIWDLDHGARWHRRGHAGVVERVAISPDGAWIASGGADRSIRLWPTPTRVGEQLVASGGAAPTYTFPAVAEVQIAATTRDGATDVWTRATGEARRLPEEIGHALQVAFLPGGELVVGTYLGVWLCGASCRPIAGAPRFVAAMAVSPGGRRVAASGADGPIVILDPAGGAPGEPLVGHAGPVQSLAFLDEERLVSAGADGTVRIWALGSRAGRILRSGPAAIRDLVVSGGGLAFHDAAGSVEVWSAEATLRARREFPGVITQLAVSPDLGTVVVGDADGDLHVWTLGGPVRTVAAHHDLVSVVLFWKGHLVTGSTDGSLVVHHGDQGVRRVWRSDGGALRRAIVRGGELVVTREEGVVEVWRAEDLLTAPPPDPWARAAALTTMTARWQPGPGDEP